MPTITWKQQPLSITAKVDALLNPSDTILWEHGFIPVTEPANDYTNSISFDGLIQQIQVGLDAGIWIISQVMGNFNNTGHNIDISTATSGYIFNFNSPLLDQYIEVSVPYGQELIITAGQNQGQFIADLVATRSYRFMTSGARPVVTTFGDQLTIGYTYGYETPCPGTFTARARVYNTSGTLQATSTDIIMNVTGAPSGGC